MRLLPSERARLDTFLAAELARRRRARGLRLNQAEAVALIADEVLEAARDGRPYAEVERRGYEVLGVNDVLPGVPRLVTRIELEPLFADGHRLVVLDDPIAADGPRPAAEPAAPDWVGATATLTATNESSSPVGVTSHFHLFELNRQVRLDRRAAWGMRLAVEAGVKVVIEPGQTRELGARPFEGGRVVRGHGGLVDGPLDAPGALDAALERARERGYLGA